MMIIFTIIILGILIQSSKASNWSKCMNSKPCSVECQQNGYLQILKEECQPPLWATCYWSKVCDPESIIFIQACIDYGFTHGEDGNCIAPECLGQYDCLDIGTTYCIDQGFVQTKDKCDCIFPKTLTQSRCFTRVFSNKIYTFSANLILILYIILA